MQHNDNLHDLAMELSLALTGFADAASRISDQVSLTLGAVDELSLPEDGDLPPAARVQALKARRNTIASQRDRKRHQRAARFERS